jgi:predicted transcriptional regulator
LAAALLAALLTALLARAGLIPVLLLGVGAALRPLTLLIRALRAALLGLIPALARLLASVHVLVRVLVLILVVHGCSSLESAPSVEMQARLQRTVDEARASVLRSSVMPRPFLFWGFKSSHEMLENSLGKLERDVMTIAWTCREVSVHDVCAQLDASVAYTTVMTTMDRLFKKRLLGRRKVGRAFVYHAVATREELEGAVASELMQSLLQGHDGEPLPLLSSLVDAVSERDRALLDELERLIREKRRAVDRGKSR